MGFYTNMHRYPDTMMEANLARHNMIEQQIRTWDVLDQSTLDLLTRLHREAFIPAPYTALAFADTSIPLPHDQFTLPPRVEARIIQSLAPRPDERALEIGTGCGYLTALLAASCEFVSSLDIYAEFTRTALEKLQAADLHNIELLTCDGLDGWPGSGPYDVIVVSGSLPELNNRFQTQLKPGGRLFVITGTSPIMQANLIIRVGENAYTREVLFETDIPALVGAVPPDTFIL